MDILLKNLISFTIYMKIFIGCNAMNLLLWHSVTFEAFLLFRRNLKWYLRLLQATDSNANRMLDGTVYAQCLEKGKIFFL